MPAVRAALAAISYHPIVHVPIGPLRISPHGVGIAVGFLIGARLMMPEARCKGYKDDDVYALLVRAAIGAMIGARLAYVVNHLSDYTHDPLGVFKVWQGGISLLGGIFGAILLALPLAKRMKLDAWELLDAAAPGLALGIVIGRIGDLIVADHLGKPTSFFLGYRCPPPSIETASPCLGTIVHQTALYDFLLTTLLLGVLLFLRHRSRDRFAGFFIIVFGAWYGVGRVIEDFLREDLRRGGLTASQWTALATVVTCIAWLLFVRRTPRWGRWRDGAVGAVDEGDVGDGGDRSVPAEPTPTMAPSPDREEQ